jgi:hypothetical protein
MRSFNIIVGLALLIPSPQLFAQEPRTTTTPTPAPIPEEARKHFVMGETMFKEARNVDNFSQAAKEFAVAARLVPSWPEARYDLALAEEAAEGYPEAVADLKLYQQFKLSDAEARTVQDKIYAIEAKQQMKVNDDALKAKAAADTQEADDREKYRRGILAIQSNFPDLISRLKGTAFVRYEGGTKITYYFLYQPFNNKGDNYPAAPYLVWQGSYTENGQTTYSDPEPVRPISNSEADQDSIQIGKITLSADGRILTEEGGVEGISKRKIFRRSE